MAAEERAAVAAVAAMTADVMAAVVDEMIDPEVAARDLEEAGEMIETERLERMTEGVETTGEVAKVEAGTVAEMVVDALQEKTVHQKESQWMCNQCLPDWNHWPHGSGRQEERLLSLISPKPC